MSNLVLLPEFKFKGERTYVQGPDLFDAVSLSLKSLGKGYVKDLTFRSFTENQCQVYTENFDQCVGSIICEGSWKSDENGELIKYRVYESDQSVSARQPFEEAKIVESCEIDNPFIVGRYVPEFSMIENIVAIVKRFHNTEYPLASGKWVFGQIVLKERLPECCDQIKIENYQNIKNRFSRNRIILDDHLVGEIRFIVA